jgi:hypothetical protein
LNFEGYIDFGISGIGAYVLLVVANACGSVLFRQVSVLASTSEATKTTIDYKSTRVESTRTPKQ